MASYTRVASGKVVYGQTTGIGATAVPLANTPTPVSYGIVISGLSANGASLVYIGPTNGVLTSNGYEIAAGAERVISVAECGGDAANIYLVSAGSLGVCWRAI